MHVPLDSPIAGGSIIAEVYRPPLAQERAAVLDTYFTDIAVDPVREGQGWTRIGHLPLLWS